MRSCAFEKTAELAWRGWSIQIRSFPEPARNKIRQPVAIKVRDLHARVRVANQIFAIEGNHLRGCELRIRTSAHVLVPRDRTRLRAGEQIESAVAVNGRAIETRIHEFNFLAANAQGHRLSESR